MASDQPAGTARLNQRMAVLCLVVFAAVLAAIYAYATSASAPAHRRADAPDASRILDRRITVRLDANTGAGMPWQFKPVEKSVTVRLGEKQTVYYRATNNTAQTITGTARFSVTPIEAAGYFKQVDCFCFTDQRVEAGQTVDMAVSFFVDPAFDTDALLKSATAITLSFTVYQKRAERDNNTGAQPAQLRRLATRNQLAARRYFAPQQEHGEHG